MDTHATHVSGGPGSSRIAVRPFILSAADGYGLGATLFSPRQAVGTVIIHGATATPQRYYRKFAEFLAEGGLRVLTYDYRGIGASRPPRLAGFAATMTEWATLDAAAAHDYIRNNFGREPVVSVGHSFGGQLLGLADEPHEVRATLLVGAQLGYLGYWTGLPRLELALTWNALIPVLTAAFGYLPGQFGLGEDLPTGVAREWASWCVSEGYLLSYHPAAYGRFARFDRPTLFFSFTDDEHAPRAAVNALLDRLVIAPVDHHRVRPEDHGGHAIGHFGFFRPRFRETLWTEARTFLLDAVHDTLALPPTTRREVPRPHDDGVGVTHEEVLADLSYGRD